MTHLTLQEVIERIRKDVPLKNNQQTQDTRLKTKDIVLSTTFLA